MDITWCSDEKPGDWQGDCWNNLTMGMWKQVRTKIFALEHAHRLTEKRTSRG